MLILGEFSPQRKIRSKTSFARYSMLRVSGIGLSLLWLLCGMNLNARYVT